METFEFFLLIFFYCLPVIGSMILISLDLRVFLRYYNVIYLRNIVILFIAIVPVINWIVFVVYFTKYWEYNLKDIVIYRRKK